MKKLLGISLIAILTAGPAFAVVPDVTSQQPATGGEASDIATTNPTWQMVAATEADASTVATTSYVKGAYNAAIKAVNNVANTANGALKKTDITTGTEGMDKGTISVGGEAVAVKGLGSAAFTESSAYATADQGAKADAAETAITKLNGGVETDGSVAKKIYDGAETGKFTAEEGFGEGVDTIAEGLNDLNMRVKDSVVESRLETTAANASDGYDINAKSLQVQGNNVLTEASDYVKTVTAATGEMDDGTISVDGVAVAVKGLKSAAFTESSAYDAAGTAATEAGAAETNAKNFVADKLGAGANGYDINANTLKVKDDDVLTKSGAQAMENKIIDATQNTISGLNKDNFAEDVVVDSIADGDGASPEKIASEKAVRDAINNLSATYATRNGVVATVNNLNFTGTVTANAVWGSENTTDIDVTMTKSPVASYSNE